MCSNDAANNVALVGTFWKIQQYRSFMVWFTDTFVAWNLWWTLSCTPGSVANTISTAITQTVSSTTKPMSETAITTTIASVMAALSSKRGLSGLNYAKLGELVASWPCQ
jgi:hypothetical protein